MNKHAQAFFTLALALKAPWEVVKVKLDTQVGNHYGYAWPGAHHRFDDAKYWCHNLLAQWMEFAAFFGFYLHCGLELP